MTDPKTDTLDASIVDTILDLDELLSADVRRAEKTARLCTKPWLEAEIDALETELDSLTDAQGNPLDYGDESIASGRSARTVALELRDKQREYAAAIRGVRMQQLPSSGAGSWDEYAKTWKDALEKGAPYPDEMIRHLVVRCAVAPTFTAAQYDQLVTRLGHPVVQELFLTAWQVNTSSGVSLPKSSRSSAVLRRSRPSTS